MTILQSELFCYIDRVTILFTLSKQNLPIYLIIKPKNSQAVFKNRTFIVPTVYKFGENAVTKIYAMTQLLTYKVRMLNFNPYNT